LGFGLVWFPLLQWENQSDLRNTTMYGKSNCLLFHVQVTCTKGTIINRIPNFAKNEAQSGHEFSDMGYII